MSRRRSEPIYALAKALIPAVVRFWVRLDCQGLAHVPREGPVLVASNHVSYFDPLCLAVFIDAAGRKVRFLAKSELFRSRVLGWLLRNVGQIPVYRESRDAARSLQDAVAAMRQGAAVAIYPEGTTTHNPDFSPGPAKSGVARLAALTGAPVVPVAMWGAHLLFTRHRYGPFRRGIRVVVRAGPPLDLGLTPDASMAALNAGRDKVMAAIRQQLVEAQQGWEPPEWWPRYEARRAARWARRDAVRERR